MAKNKKLKKSRPGKQKKYRGLRPSEQRSDPVVMMVEGPASPVRHVRLSEAMAVAAANAQQGRVPLAQAIYGQLMDQCPDRSEPAIQLLRSLYSIGNMEAAQLHAYRMLSVLKRDAAAVVEVALFYSLKGESARAMELLQMGLEVCPPESRDVLYRNIANIYDSQGDQAQATAFYRKALTVNERDVLSLYGLTKIEKHQSRDELIERLLALENVFDANALEYPYLHFALAYLFEKQDNKKYFHHLKLANEVVAQDSAPYLDIMNRYFQWVSENLSRDRLAGFFKHESLHERPPIFIVAPPRSGTTLVEQILSAHPDVLAVGESGAVVGAINQISMEMGGNTAFWDWDDNQQRQTLPKLENYFFANDKIPTDKKKTLVDKSIENFQHLGLILLTWPEARIVRLKRHPLDTILSCYHQFFASGYDRYFDLESLARYYVLVQQYMDFWQGLFPDNILTLEYEDLVADQEQQTRHLLEFCQLPWSDRCLEFYQNVGTVLTVSNLQVRQPLYKKSVGKWRPYIKELQPAARILETELGLSFPEE